MEYNSALVCSQTVYLANEIQKKKKGKKGEITHFPVLLWCGLLAF
jgi:hypothetical protein